MSRIKLGISGLSATGLFEKAQFIVNQMTGNPNFATPTPALADVQTAIDELVEANENALTGAHNLITIRDEKQAVLEGLLRQLSAYVQLTSDGDKVIIESSGFGVVERGGPIGTLPAVQNLRASLAGIPGAVKLTWASVRGAKSYNVQMTQTNPADPQVQWAIIGTSTRARFKAEGLTPGQFYWFRVIAVGAAGPGEVSDPAMMVVM